MRSILTIISMTVLVISTALGQKSKDLEADAEVGPDQVIRLEDFRSVDLTVRTWDQPRVEVKLAVRIEMSSEDAEQEYIEEVKLETDQSSGAVVFRLDLPEVNTGFNLKNLLSLRFNTYVKREIRGEVFVPSSNAFFADARYGKIDVEGINGTVEIESQSSLIDIRSCPQLEAVQNNYGTTVIEQSGGALTLQNKSGRLDIRSFEGSVNVQARYSTMTIEEITGAVEVESQSGSVTLQSVGSDAVVNAPYSTIVLEDIDGSADVTGKSGSVKVVNAKGVDVDAPYSTIDIQDVDGVANRPVTVTGQSGRISLMRVASAVDVQSPYTNIDLTDIGGEVQLGTKSGNVRARNVRGNWTSKTEYSRLTLSDVGATNVVIENKSGVIELDLSVVPESVEILNSYADIRLDLPKGLDADVRLKAEYGSISSDLDVQIEKMGSSALALGKAGSGTGTMNIETKSGNIRIREK